MRSQQYRVLPQFKEVPPEHLGECFYSAFGIDVSDAKLEEVKNHVDTFKTKDMVRIRITFDEEQQKWLDAVTKEYELGSVTEALNVCLKLCENHPLFNV